MNQQQKYILNLQRKSRERKREQAFVIEGRKMFVEELGLDYGKAKALLLMHGSVKKAVDAYRI